MNTYSNAALEDLLNLLDKIRTPFIGYTLRPAEFRWFEQHNYPKNDSRVFLPRTQFVPAYCVPNQPCPIVQWSSEKQMLKFVARKDREEYAQLSA